MYIFHYIYQYFSDLESAEGVLNLMKESNLEPLSDTYSLLASGFAKKGDIKKILEIIETCNKKDINLNDKEYLDIVYSLAISGHSDKISHVNILLKSLEANVLILRYLTNKFIFKYRLYL